MKMLRFPFRCANCSRLELFKNNYLLDALTDLRKRYQYPPFSHPIFIWKYFPPTASAQDPRMDERENTKSSINQFYVSFIRLPFSTLLSLDYIRLQTPREFAVFFRDDGLGHPREWQKRMLFIEWNCRWNISIFQTIVHAKSSLRCFFHSLVPSSFSCKFSKWNEKLI